MNQPSIRTKGLRTKALAEWAAKSTYADFPKTTTNHAKSLLLKTFTGMLVGSREPISKILSTYYAEQGGTPDAGIAASGYRTSVENAAFANATFAHASELEDNELPSITSDYWMFPALFTLAQKQFSSGKELIGAAIVSWEVASRFCRAGPGWMLMAVHICPPSWFGPLGVAAGCSSLLKLDAGRTEHAMNMAGSSASGLGQAGCDQHFLESGHSCKMGLQSALLAKVGATSEIGVLEADNALWVPIGAAKGTVDLSIIDAGLGHAPYSIEQACIKKYSACTYTHPALDAVGLIVKEQGLSYDDIDYVEDHMGAGGMDFIGSHPDPVDLQEARFSIEYLMAELMLHGSISVHTFEDTNKLTDPKHIEAKGKVRKFLHPEIPYASPGAEVVVATKKGKKYTKRLNLCVGSPETPMSFDEVRAVCRPYLEVMLNKEQCDRVEEIMTNLENQPDIQELMDILTFARVGRR